MKPIKTSFLFFLLSLLCFNKHIEAQNNPDSTYFYVESIKSSKKNNDVVNAILYLQNLNNLHKKDDNILALVYNLTYIASAQKKIGFIYEAEKTAIEAIKLLDQIEGKNNDYRIPLNNFLGNLYLDYEDYNTSLKYYNSVLDLNNNSKNRVTIINNIGKVYLEQKDYNSSIEFFKESYLNSLNFNKKENTARALDNLGFAQSKIENPDALTSLTEAMEIRLKLNYTPGIIESYIHIGEYYKDRNNEIKALEYANRAIEVAEASGNSDYLLNTLSFYSSLNKDSKILKLNKLEDSINKSNRLAQNKYASKKYAFEKQEKIANEAKLKLKDSELENERQKNINLIYLFIGLSILLLSIFLYFFLKSKHKKDKIKEAYLKETELSKKVHDELANDMSDLMNFVENDIEVTQAKKSLLLDNIEDIYLRTRDISTETGSIELANFSDSIKHLLMQHNKPETKVVTNDINKIDWQSIEEHKKVVIYRCLQELLVNMKKHSKAKVVSIVFKNHNRKKEIKYVDDGIGFSVNGTKLNGLANVESRINGIGGSFNFTTSKGNGFKATLEFNS
ncbi:tetratricopeptide repeat-containing sensor histidine kinase [Winogradskyella haliclonae]|uniref:Tetratricopeptide repeat protein n=1 Tax=Winogradskyella haliclonae TaxID=2048558 RepID=A0ABQ2BZK7_9FLAO|nr:tetratricopeptide repeat-containing sensor histidine kinase [Winogradskyella haliclonae]GGI56982.1 hypothetical protein GCM10011444_12910 [Winogradskyella haliclonae]